MSHLPVSERLTLIETRLRKEINAQLTDALLPVSHESFVDDNQIEEEKEKFGDTLRSSTIQQEEDDGKLVDLVG